MRLVYSHVEPTCTHPFVDDSYLNDSDEKVYRTFVRLYGTTLFQKYPTLRILEEIDAGSYGHIFEIEFSDMEGVFAVKMEEYDDRFKEDEFLEKFQNEVSIQSFLVDTGLTLPVHKAGLYQSNACLYSYLIMDRLNPDTQFTLHNLLQHTNLTDKVFDILYHKLFNVLTVLCELDVVHGDLHWKNLFLTVETHQKQKWTTENVSIGVLDFGMSRIHTCNPELELMALGSSCAQADYPPRTIQRLLHLLLRLLDAFQLPHPNDLLYFSKRYTQLLTSLT